jgi:preprotein translocase subunit SecA
MWHPTSMYHWFRKAGRTTEARLSRWRSMAGQVIRRSEELQNWSDQELRRHAHEIRWQAKTGIPLANLLTEAFAMVREASRRTTGLLHYPVQVMGGIALFEGHIAEMQTGEGKTLTATMPTFLRALPGLGTHVITVNDYLAERDAKLNGDIYKLLGLSVGCILTPMETDERREAYAKDVTYGTAKEMGFDFLRDRLRIGAGGRRDDRHPVFNRQKAEGEQPVQRGHHFALIDEADSILIDEARTPLIIGLTMPNDAATVNLLRWSHRAVRHFEPNKDFIYEPDRRTAYLTDAGCRRVLLLSKPSLLDTIDTERIYTHVEQAITAKFAFERDRDYVIVDDEIVIVDESTGRLMDGRKWQDGLHQAVEAKELVPITAATGQAARITVQDYFRQYTHLAGMTGTAVLARRELKRIYRLKVTPIPTNKACIRKGLPARIFANREAKREAIVEEIANLNQAGRAVLIGTPSVEASELLGAALSERGISHKILNARYHEIEADIVAEAGGPGKVTIATNMAGRGTDILLEPEVRENGGLHVIATEMHTSARIDRQLVGRAARQGDPGSFQFFLSLDDELLRCLTPEARQKLRDQANPNKKGELASTWLGVFQRTQRFLERMHIKQRKMMLRQEKQKNKIYRQMGLDPYLELTE